nr:hypothetical protein [bacterium]
MISGSLIILLRFFLNHALTTSSLNISSICFKASSFACSGISDLACSTTDFLEVSVLSLLVFESEFSLDIGLLHCESS